MVHIQTFGYIPSLLFYLGRYFLSTLDYAAIFHRGGFWAEGLYGQVLYVNTKKNYIAVFLGADRIEDYCYVFDRLYEIL
mgnify:CR=1 FL=1